MAEHEGTGGTGTGAASDALRVRRATIVQCRLEGIPAAILFWWFEALAWLCACLLLHRKVNLSVSQHETSLPGLFFFCLAALH